MQRKRGREKDRQRKKKRKIGRLRAIKTPVICAAKKIHVTKNGFHCLIRYSLKAQDMCNRF